MSERHHVAVIGAGPIGLELAAALKKAGVDYVHFDGGQIGSTVAWYPLEMVFHSSPDRLAIAGVPIQLPDQQKPTREAYLAYLRAVVMQFGLEVRTFERVERTERRGDGTFVLHTRAVDGEHEYEVDAVVLAVGAMHVPRRLGIPGEDLPHVSHYFNDPHTYFGKKLLIVGGRNSAVEAAVRCQRVGAHVTISYRRDDFDKESVKFWLLPEVRGMIRDGRVTFLPRTVPVEIRGGSVTLSPTNDRGEPLPGAPASEVAADFVLLLTGYRQETPLFDMLGVDMRGNDRKPLYDPETMETNIPGVFIAGTAVAGSPDQRVSVIVETCHEHVPKAVDTIVRRLNV